MIKCVSKRVTPSLGRMLALLAMALGMLPAIAAAADNQATNDGAVDGAQDADIRVTQLAQADDDDDDDDDDEALEEVVVVGTQIRGAGISEALAVSIFDAEKIETFGISSGDELLDFIPEQGQNFFNEAENISGGVNSASDGAADETEEGEPESGLCRGRRYVCAHSEAVLEGGKGGQSENERACAYMCVCDHSQHIQVCANFSSVWSGSASFAQGVGIGAWFSPVRLPRISLSIARLFAFLPRPLLHAGTT